MKYFKVFSHTSAYTEYIKSEEAIFPNIAYCVNDNKTYVMTEKSSDLYQWVQIPLSEDYDCDMVEHVKYYKEKEQVSHNGGITWEDTGNERRGESAETSSVDCGYVNVTSITLSDNSISIDKDDTYTLTATVLPAEATNKNVTWSSSDSSIATVDSNGVVSGVAYGNVTITVTTVDGGYTAQCSVSVSEYTELEYIASTSDGGQYIDLDIMLYDELDKWYDIAIKFNAIGAGKGGSTQPTMFGCQDNTGSPWPGTFIRKDASKNNMVGRYIGGSGKDNILGSTNTIIELAPKDAPSMNVYNLNNSGQTHTWGTSLFCIFNNQAKTTFDRFIEAKLYYFKLYSKASETSQGVLVRDMMPCKRKSDNVVGLLDKVNNVFYTTPSGDAFVAGPVVNS